MSNEIIRREENRNIFGVDVKAFNVVANTETGIIRNQTIKTSRQYEEGGREYRLIVELRFDDECGNKKESFAITGDIREKDKYGSWREYAGGCVHEEIAKHFPELAHLIKWHLVSTDGPMHYIANTTYHASNRDCNGLLAGERRQIKNGRTGNPSWHLVAVSETGEEVELHKLEKYQDSAEKPLCNFTIEYRPWCRIGEGKERQFDYARSTAVWPDATDEQLSLPKEELTELLLARLPGLLDNFKAAMLACGFIYPEHIKEVSK